MAFNINWSGTPAKIEPLPTYAPDQIAAMQQNLKQGQADFDPSAIDALARKNYFGKTVPRLNTMFTAAGGGQRSGNLLSALSSSASDLESQLAAQRSNTALQRLQIGLTPQYEYMYTPEKAGFGEKTAEKLLTSVLEDFPGLIKKGTDLYDWYQGRGAKKGETSTAEDVANAATAAKNATDVASDIRSAVFPSTGDAQKMQAADKMQQMVQKQSALNALKQGALKPGTTAKDALATTAAVTSAGSAATQAATGGGLAKAATAVATYGPPIAAGTAGLFGLYKLVQGVGGMIRDRRRENQGPQPEPLPANWQDMSGPERYEYTIARQIATPQGQISHDAIRRMEYDLGIQPNEKLSWQERYAQIVAKKGRK